MDLVLFFTVILLAAAGVITVYSASTVVAMQLYGVPANYFALRQLMAGVIGLAAMYGVSWLPHRFLYKWSLPIMLGNLFLLLLVLVPHVGQKQLGGQRWIGSGSYHLQPSELAVLAIVVYLAFFFTKQVTLLHSVRRGLMPALIVVGINFLLIFVEPDMGTAMTLLGTSLVVIFASGARVKPLAILIGVLAPLLVGLASVASYRSDRLAAWLHPFQHSQDISYQLIQGMTGIASGGLFGRGFGQSMEKAGYLPFPQTDFVFPVFVEEWGLVGAVALLTAFGVLIWRGFRVARRSPDRFGSLLCVGLTSQLIISAFINLGAVTGLLPVTGIPLPFMSYGGTDLIVNMVGMGVLLGVSRVSLDEEPTEDQLADVVPVEAFAERRLLRHAGPARPPVLGLETAPRAPRRAAEVHPMRPTRQRGQAATAGWRTRRETAAANTANSRMERAVREPGRRERTAPRYRGETLRPAQSWRERQSRMGTAAPPRDSGKKSKRPKKKER